MATSLSSSFCSLVVSLVAAFVLLVTVAVAAFVVSVPAAAVAARASLGPKAVVSLADGAAVLSFGWLLGVIFQKEEVAMLSEKMRGLE